MKSLKSKGIGSRASKLIPAPANRSNTELATSSSRSDDMMGTSPRTSSKNSKKRKASETLPAISPKPGSGTTTTTATGTGGATNLPAARSSFSSSATARTHDTNATTTKPPPLVAEEKVVPSALTNLTNGDPAMDDDVVVGDIFATPTLHSAELGRGARDSNQLVSGTTVSFQSSSASLSGTPISQAGMYSISLSAQRRHEDRKKEREKHNNRCEPSPPKESPIMKHIRPTSTLQQFGKMHLQNVTGSALDDVPFENSEVLWSVSPQSQQNIHRSSKRFGSGVADREGEVSNRGNSFSQGMPSRSVNSGLSRNSSMLDTGTTPLRRKTHTSSEGVMDSLVIRSVDSNTRIGEKSFMRVSVAHRTLIGKGSFGVVFQAMDRDTNHLIAVKEMVFDSNKRSPQLDSILKELDMLKKLNHPNIVRCLGEEYDERALRIYMEYVSGGTISSALKAFGPLTEKQTVLFARQLLDGLMYLHSQNILHRDLKGDNLLIDTQGVLKIADFGAAQYMDDDEQKVTVGTPSFMAPEVITKSIYSKSADVWAAACCLLEMLTGNPPLSNLKNHYVIMMRVADGFNVDEVIPPKVSAPAQTFFRRCLQIDPQKRPTAQELLKDPWIIAPPEEPTVDGMLPVRDRFSIDQRYANRKKKSSNLSELVRNGKRTSNEDHPLSPMLAEKGLGGESARKTSLAAPKQVTPISSSATAAGPGRNGSSSSTSGAAAAAVSSVTQRHRLSPLKDRNGRLPSPLATAVANTPDPLQSSLTELPPTSPAVLSSSMSSTTMTMSKAYDTFANTAGEYDRWMTLNPKTPSRSNSRTAAENGDYDSEEDGAEPRRGSLMPVGTPTTLPRIRTTKGSTVSQVASELGMSVHEKEVQAMKGFSSTMQLERHDTNDDDDVDEDTYGSFNDRDASFSMHSRNSLMKIDQGTSFGILKIPTTPQQQQLLLSQSSPYASVPVPRYENRDFTGDLKGSVYDMRATSMPQTNLNTTNHSSSGHQPPPLSPSSANIPESSLYFKSGDLTFYDFSYAPQPPAGANPSTSRQFFKINSKKKP